MVDLVMIHGSPLATVRRDINTSSAMISLQHSMIPPIHFGSIALLLLTLVFCATGQTIVDLGYARYQGTSDEFLNITTYLGLRYAAPPVGELLHCVRDFVGF
jgi:hypothetical protein